MPKTTPDEVRILCVGFAYTGPLEVDLKLREPDTGLLSYIQEPEASIDALKDFLRSLGPKEKRLPVVVTTSVRELHRMIEESLHIPTKKRPAVHGFVVCDDTVALQQVPHLTILDLAPGEPGQGWRSRKVRVYDLLKALKGKASVGTGELGGTRNLDLYFKQPITAKELIERLEQSLKSHVPKIRSHLVNALLCTTKESEWNALRKRLLSLSQDNDSVMEFDMFLGTDTAVQLRKAHERMADRSSSAAKASAKTGASLEDLTFLISAVSPKKGTKYHHPKPRKGGARDDTPKGSSEALDGAE